MCSFLPQRYAWAVLQSHLRGSMLVLLTASGRKTTPKSRRMSDPRNSHLRRYWWINLTLSGSGPSFAWLWPHIRSHSALRGSPSWFITFSSPSSSCRSTLTGSFSFSSSPPKSLNAFSFISLCHRSTMTLAPNGSVRTPAVHSHRSMRQATVTAWKLLPRAAHRVTSCCATSKLDPGSFLNSPSVYPVGYPINLSLSLAEATLFLLGSFFDSNKNSSL